MSDNRLLLILASLAVSMASPAPAQSVSAPQRAPNVCTSVAEPAEAARCDQAIATETDLMRKRDLRFSRAYANNEREHYEDALSDLNTILATSPDDISALHERAYTLNSIARYHEAEVDLDRLVQLQPGETTHYQERAFARFHQANFDGALADRTMVVSLEPNDAGALVGRAEAEMWLGRFEDARRDLQTASGAARQNDEHVRQDADRVQRQLALWTTTSGNDVGQTCNMARLQDGVPQGYLGDCTVAFLHARTNAQRAEALTNRAQAWDLVLQEREGPFLIDLEIAAALDPGNWMWHANLGGLLVSMNHSWAARLECDRSITLEPNNNWTAYACRGAANYNLGDFTSAFADSRRSYEIQPNVVALMTLGDLALNQHHDTNAARTYWMAAYHLGVHDDGLIARLRSVGVTDPVHAEPPQAHP